MVETRLSRVSFLDPANWLGTATAGFGLVAARGRGSLNNHTATRQWFAMWLLGLGLVACGGPSASTSTGTQESVTQASAALVSSQGNSAAGTAQLQWNPQSKDLTVTLGLNSLRPSGH